MRVAFNDLPKPVRERFISIASGSNPQGALLHSTQRYHTWLFPVLAVFALAGAIYAIVFNIQQAERQAPYFSRTVYILLGVELFVFLASAATFVLRMIWKKPSFRNGS